MVTVKIVSHVAPDGTVSVTLPAGTAVPGDEVLVTVGPPATTRGLADLPDDQWMAAFRKTQGSIADPTFSRPDQPRTDPAPDFD